MEDGVYTVKLQVGTNRPLKGFVWAETHPTAAGEFLELWVLKKNFRLAKPSAVQTVRFIPKTGADTSSATAFFNWAVSELKSVYPAMTKVRSWDHHGKTQENVIAANVNVHQCSKHPDRLTCAGSSGALQADSGAAGIVLPGGSPGVEQWVFSNHGSTGNTTEHWWWEHNSASSMAVQSGTKIWKFKTTDLDLDGDSQDDTADDVNDYIADNQGGQAWDYSGHCVHTCQHNV